MLAMYKGQYYAENVKSPTMNNRGMGPLGPINGTSKISVCVV